MMLQHLSPIRLLLSLAIATRSLARRGGGVGGDGENDRDASSYSSETSSNDENCGLPRSLLSKSDLIPHHVQNWTSTWAGAGRGPTTYDGSYFEGNAKIDYSIFGEPELSSCRAEGSLRMLGYGWVGPQPPYPKGPTNTFIVSFKAWESRKPLEKITYSYKEIKWTDLSCPVEPDLVRVMSSRGWADLERGKGGADDVMIMDVSNDPMSNAKIIFNATAASNLDYKLSIFDVMIRIPGRVCDQNGALTFLIPAKTFMIGSITNETLELSYFGSGNTIQIERGDTYNIVFNVTFQGLFDSTNSTESLNIHHGNRPILTWVRNSSVCYTTSALKWSFLLSWVLREILM